MRTIIVSEQFLLTPLELCDANEVFALTDGNRAYLRRWLPWLDNIRGVEDTRSFIRAAQVQAAQNNGAQLAIKLQGRIAGIVGHHQIDWRNRLTSLGYWIGETSQGRGLITTACRALIAHAFDEARLNRVEIRCAVGNHRSRAIPQRLGFRQEGLFRDAEWLYGHFVDHVVYAMLVREWETSAGNAVRSTRQENFR